jgi:hypothetical protein
MTAQVSAALTWPVLGATAVTVGLLVLLAGRVVGPVVSVAHEGGHMAIGFLNGGKVEYFRLKPDSVNAETKFDRLPGWLGDILTTFAGYVTPPLLGLGGAVLLKEGYAWPLLWIAVILFFVVWVKAKDELTGVALLLMAGFLVYVGLYGSPTMQAAFAAGLVLLLLLGGLRSAAYSEIAKGKDSDAEFLARATLIPRVLWKAAYVIVALLCLWKGIIILLR